MSAEQSFLMRHPESEQNATGIKMFDIGDPDLSRLGHRQGHATGRYLGGLYNRGVRLDAIICSPARRALLGGIIVQRYIPEVPLEVDDRLSEIDWGEWAGKLQADVMTPDVQKQIDASGHNGLAHCPPGGSSMVDAYEAFRDIREEFSGYNTLMVSHGFKIKSLIAGQLALTRRVAREIPVANAELLQFQPEPGVRYADPEQALNRLFAPPAQAA